MKILVYILTLIPFLTFGQQDKTTLFESYSYSDTEFYYRLDLHTDSTFEYEFAFKLGSTKSNGKWQINNDTLLLLNYETPWKIANIVEKKMDTLYNKILIEIKVDKISFVKSQSDVVLHIDENPTNVKFNDSQGEHKVKDFEVWINGNCQDIRSSNENGIVQFNQDSILKISIDYDDYYIKNMGSNYFILKLSNFPIFVSPPTLKWTRWKICNNTLMPIECKELLEYILLKK